MRQSHNKQKRIYSVVQGRILREEILDYHPIFSIAVKQNSVFRLWVNEKNIFRYSQDGTQGADIENF